MGSLELLNGEGERQLFLNTFMWKKSSYEPSKWWFWRNRQVCFWIWCPKLDSDPVTRGMILRKGMQLLKNSKSLQNYAGRYKNDHVVKWLGFIVMNYPSRKPSKQLQWKNSFLPTSYSLFTKRTKSGSGSYRQCYTGTRFLWFTSKHPCEQEKAKIL